MNTQAFIHVQKGILRAPFPWFGGKSAAAKEIWSRFGDVANYVEPFFGSGAVLLARPHPGQIETINDKDAFVSNFWRAVQADPAEVAKHADWPVNEADLQSRHYWLVTEGAKRIASISGDPTAYDVQVAGWWVWGLCSWIGSGWCGGSGPWVWTDAGWEKGSAGQGINRQLPHLGDAGQGINRQLPHLGDAGRGINRKLPHLGDAGQGEFIEGWMRRLSARLRDVRVVCGDWSRVCGPSVTTKHGVTGVFLDPPYAAAAGRTDGLYAVDDLSVAHDVRRWAIEEGKNKLMRICLAGYEGEHDMPSDWTAIAWKAQGGYGSQSDDGIGRINSTRERLWFSPHCLKVERAQLSIFDLVEAAE